MEPVQVVIVLDHGFFAFCRHVAINIDTYDDPLIASSVMAKAMKHLIPIQPANAIFKLHGNNLCEEIIVNTILNDAVIIEHVRGFLEIDENGCFYFKTLLDGVRGFKLLFTKLYYSHALLKDIISSKLVIFEKCVHNLEFILNNHSPIQ
jgi:hypothetical protein